MTFYVCLFFPPICPIFADYTVVSWLTPRFTSFTENSAPLSKIIPHFNLTHHLYAEDTHIYFRLDSRHFGSSIIKVADCLDAVQVWMGNTKLMLNPDKTEFIPNGGHYIRDFLMFSFPLNLLYDVINLAVSL